MDLNKVFLELKNNFPNLEIYQNHPLAPYTTVKIGGPADIFIHTQNSDEFLQVLKYLKSEVNNFSEHSERELQNYEPEGSEHRKNSFTSDNILILGNGSNVLISDSGIRGIVIKNDSSEMEIIDNNKVKVSSGTQLSSLIEFTLDKNLLGLEEFAYIPSTIGGAIAGNIHGTKGNFSDYIESVEKYNDFIISAFLKLNQGNPTQAKQQVKDTIQKKSQVQSMISLGSVFKNPTEEDCVPIWGQKKSAGLIIDTELKLKGKSFGGAQISPLHANFIVNNGNATAKDYISLIDLIQSQMQANFGFQFEPEIKFLGDF